MLRRLALRDPVPRAHLEAELARLWTLLGAAAAAATPAARTP